jgi:hypothetical protein
VQRLATLVRNTPADKKTAANRVKVTHFTQGDVKVVQEEGRDVWEVAFKTSGSGGPHDCIVRFFSPRIHQDAIVWVSCDCDDFRYRIEYALAQKKSSEILHGNRRPPVRTNPKMQTRLCKHLVKIIGIIPLAQSYMEPQQSVRGGV